MIRYLQNTVLIYLELFRITKVDERIDHKKVEGERVKANFSETGDQGILA